jgi:hypothetical protein
MDTHESQPELQPELQEALPPRPATNESLAILDLQQQVQDLKRLFNATFVALIALALGVNLLMAKETRIVRRDLNLKQPVWLKEIDQFRKFDEPEIRKFMAELHLYAASHRDYQTNILERYRASMPQYFSTPAVVSPKGPPPARQPGQ